ncbi:uncharacterized protein LOC130821215 [Amaranthus tricolor]|uniref:uncharacterized protein LOC130821215 n=1 Tax=Amaranthus tricolor TaxID=29722 RepID=UPI0025872296|nr:uncharacterized protein LOC130821215 [Amaranthus tricolor]
MGTSESVGVRESGAGSIVWVRRRNGSWWPGKILGQIDLSTSHLMSPRSGTPVKLLGREDASVDWYNLEKSKRVKAFRCGEFDDCIERAEASLGLPAKKRDKYARREDAILHALELEKQFSERKYGKLVGGNSARENSSDSDINNLVEASGVLENRNEKIENLDLCQLDKTITISDLIDRKSIPQHIHEVKVGAQPSVKGCGTDLSCPIQELTAVGLKAVPINGRFSASAAFEDSKKLIVDGHTWVSTAESCFENSSDSDSGVSLGKRKRSLEGFVEESLSKRCDSFHSFVNIKQNNAELHDSSLRPGVHRKWHPIDGVHHSMYLPSDLQETFVTTQDGLMEVSASHLEECTDRSQHGTFEEETTSRSSEETESDSSETHSLEAHVEAREMLSDAETCTRAHPRIHDSIIQMQVSHESTSSDEFDERSLDDRSQCYLHDPSPAAAVSKWQLKGKRNVRNINRTPIDRFANRTHLQIRGRSMSMRVPSSSLSYYHDNGYPNDGDFKEDKFDPQSPGFYLPSLDITRKQNFIGQNMVYLEEFTGRPLRAYWDDRGSYFNPIFDGQDGYDLLIDVDLNVQANHRGNKHVPWVSLMSWLNGKAIIGHPIQIETLVDGSTDIFVTTSYACCNVRYDFDRRKVPQVWRTAKRTANFRVPRPHSSSSQLDDAEDDQNTSQSGKVRCKKSLVSNSVSKGKLMKRNTHSSKPWLKVNLSYNQKTKTLSSIGFNQKFPIKRKGEDTSNHINGVMKSVVSRPPTVACIPVKLVFSRLLEAVGRSPSAPSKHGFQ